MRDPNEPKLQTLEMHILRTDPTPYYDWLKENGWWTGGRQLSQIERKLWGEVWTSTCDSSSKYVGPESPYGMANVHCSNTTGAEFTTTAYQETEALTSTTLTEVDIAGQWEEIW